MPGNDNKGWKENPGSVNTSRRCLFEGEGLSVDPEGLKFLAVWELWGLLFQPIIRSIRAWRYADILWRNLTEHAVNGVSFRLYNLFFSSEDEKKLSLDEGHAHVNSGCHFPDAQLLTSRAWGAAFRIP